MQPSSNLEHLFYLAWSVLAGFMFQLDIEMSKSKLFEISFRSHPYIYTQRWPFKYICKKLVYDPSPFIMIEPLSNI